MMKPPRIPRYEQLLDLTRDLLLEFLEAELFRTKSKRWAPYLNRLAHQDPYELHFRYFGLPYRLQLEITYGNAVDELDGHLCLYAVGNPFEGGKGTPARIFHDPQSAEGTHRLLLDPRAKAFTFPGYAFLVHNCVEPGQCKGPEIVDLVLVGLSRSIRNVTAFPAKGDR